MDYSSINKLVYDIGLKKTMFVIGGEFAAALCEPAIARMRGLSGGKLHVYISASNFEILKGYKGRGVERLETEGDTITLNDRYWHITFERGMPAHWTTRDGYMVIDPLPLKRWLDERGLVYMSSVLQDKPFENRMAGWELSEEELMFKKACGMHDWYSEYSDDYVVRQRGEVGLKELKEWRDRLGGNAHLIFDHYSTR